jgi:predicted nucleotidyltransferase
MTDDPTAIDQLIRQIVEMVHPVRIIVFGSAARGEMKRDSDVDLLIVMPEGAHRRKIAQKIYKGLTGIRVPFDILVATPSDLERYKDNIGLIYGTVLREGKEVYAA